MRAWPVFMSTGRGAALEALVAADASWSREIAGHRGLASLAGRDELAAELPRRSDEQRAALEQWDDQLRDDPGALVPVPRSLLPRARGDVRHDADGYSAAHWQAA